MVLQPADLGLMGRGHEESALLRAIDLSGTLSEVGQRALRFIERSKILAALTTNSGNKSRTAEELGVSYKTLLTKIRDYDL
jgi:transcriptional regulator with PAS, ATPase and Fis domain